jgi:hypothetical protein
MILKPELPFAKYKDLGNRPAQVSHEGIELAFHVAREQLSKNRNAMEAVENWFRKDQQGFNDGSNESNNFALLVLIMIDRYASLLARLGEGLGEERNEDPGAEARHRRIAEYRWQNQAGGDVTEIVQRDIKLYMDGFQLPELCETMALCVRTGDQTFATRSTRDYVHEPEIHEALDDTYYIPAVMLSMQPEMIGTLLQEEPSGVIASAVAIGGLMNLKQRDEGKSDYALPAAMIRYEYEKDNQRKKDPVSVYLWARRQIVEDNPNLKDVFSNEATIQKTQEEEITEEKIMPFPVAQTQCSGLVPTLSRSMNGIVVAYDEYDVGGYSRSILKHAKLPRFPAVRIVSAIELDHCEGGPPTGGAIGLELSFRHDATNEKFRLVCVLLQGLESNRYAMLRPKQGGSFLFSKGRVSRCIDERGAMQLVWDGTEEEEEPDGIPQDRTTEEERYRSLLVLYEPDVSR